MQVPLPSVSQPLGGGTAGARRITPSDNRQPPRAAGSHPHPRWPAASSDTRALAMPGPLSRAQIGDFKAQGVVILPGFVDEEQLQSWRDQVGAGLDADPDDPSTWPINGGHAAVDMPSPLTPTPGGLPQFQALIEQLGGGHFTGGGAQIAAIFPNTSLKDWTLPSNGHVDGYNANWRGVGQHRVCTTFYLNDVEEKGGCFTYWKGGHKKLHEWYREHPEEVDGRFTETERYRIGEHAYQGAGIVGTQHAVKAGTVCVWHGWCPHQASANANDTPRLALISRELPQRPTTHFHLWSGPLPPTP